MLRTADALAVAFSLIWALAPSAEAADWRYLVDEDKLRGITDRSAVVESTDVQGTQAGATHLMVAFRGPATRHVAVLSIQKGLFRCQPDPGAHDALCRINYRLDSGPVSFAYAHFASPDGYAALALVDGETFFKRFVEAKKAIIEVQFFGDGARQFEFDINPLDRAFMP